MSGFYVPDFDAVQADGQNIAERGRHDCTATKIEAKESRSGRDMMVIEWTVDNGPSAGHTIVDYITFGLKGMIGETRLKRICEAAGFRWRQASSLQDFVGQFPAGRLRASVLVDHQYSVQKGDAWETVPEATFQSFDGKKNTRAVVADNFQSAEQDYLPPQKPAALDTRQPMIPGDGGLAPATYAQGVPAGQEKKFNTPDGLPF